jgi:elongator complex protein 4
MSSFRRLKPSATPAPPVGSLTFPSLALPHLSTGVASLDDVLAPGQPLSSALLVRTPDGHSAWARLLERYWIAQGLVSGQGVVIVAGPGESEDVAQGMMWDVNAPRQAVQAAEQADQSGAESDGEDVLGDAEVDANRTKIAWRYGGLGKFKTTVDSSTSSGKSLLWPAMLRLAGSSANRLRTCPRQPMRSATASH